MSFMEFQTPIFVTSIHGVREITGLEDAVEFFAAWPKATSDLMSETVEKACRDAIRGRYPIHAAEQNFRCFARKKNILCRSQDAS